MRVSVDEKTRWDAPWIRRQRQNSHVAKIVFPIIRTVMIFVLGIMCGLRLQSKAGEPSLDSEKIYKAGSIVEDTTQVDWSKVGRWPNPTLVVGFPKSGTSTIRDFFECGGVPKISHFRCRPRQTCGAMVQANVKNNRPPLLHTQRHNVYTQLDAEFDINKKKTCYFPQIEALEELHERHPNSTFILNTRNVDDWINSVRSWARMDYRLAICNITGFPPVSRGVVSDKELKSFYHGQIERIRRFVKGHPSHRLVEVKIDSPEAGKVMEQAFGIDKSCWGHSNNRNIKGEKLKNRG